MALRLIGALAPALLLAQSWGTRPPRVISRVEAEYSEEARRAGVNTTVVVSLTVNENGAPQDIKIVRGAGFGLDERAIRAIESWRFEPGSKEGKPQAAATRVEIHFGLSDKAHAGQTARLNFNLAPDVESPELIRGKIPANPDPPAAGSLRIRLTVGADGRTRNLQTFETDNQDWTNRVLKEMAGWRFRPAMHAGQPEEVNGIFEVAVRQKAAENQPNLTRRLVAISPPTPQDVSLPAPKPVAPNDKAMFDGYPRHVTCKWEASPGAVAYLLEWDYMYHDVWHAEAEGMPGAAYEVAGTETSFDFVGAQSGRWRVWPVNGSGQRGNPSEWRTFRYLQ
jgi:TonB family protein